MYFFNMFFNMYYCVLNVTPYVCIFIYVYMYNMYFSNMCFNIRYILLRIKYHTARMCGQLNKNIFLVLHQTKTTRYAT